jgi:hypothetical protein
MASTDLIASLISDVSKSQGIRLVAGSNITPEFTLYDASDTSQSLLDTLGIRSYARVIDKNGNVLASYGDGQSFNLVLAAAYWSFAALAIFAIVKGFKK